jgi:Sec-independent protein translocase protein TatA
MKRTADGIVGAYDTRIAALGSLVGGVHDTLNGFATNRKKSSREQDADLSGFANGLARGVARMLREFQISHNSMATELAASLKQVAPDLEREVSGLLKGFTQNYERMSRKLHSDLDDYVSATAKETRGLLSGFRRENQATHSTWRDLTKTMAARRNGKQTAPEAGRRTHPRHKAAKR